MAKRDIVALIEALVQPIVNEHHFECVDVEYVKEAGTWFLRVFIDKEGGITIDDCELVSRALDVKIDQEDPIEEAYILEVSSPGLDRPLKKPRDYERSIGKDVEIKLYKAVDGVKEVIGVLEGYTDEDVTLNIEGTLLTIIKKDIAIIRLAVLF